jgi:hypothetical protein
MATCDPVEAAWQYGHTARSGVTAILDQLRPTRFHAACSARRER